MSIEHSQGSDDASDLLGQKLLRVQDRLIASFCDGCDRFNPVTSKCNLLYRHDQYRAAAEGQCDSAEIDWLPYKKVLEIFTRIEYSE